MLGENIKALRAKKGYTQRELADLLHVTAQAVSRWENGDVEPSVATIREMARLFDVSVDYLIGDGTEPAEEPASIAENEPKDAPDTEAIAATVAAEVLKAVEEKEAAKKAEQKPVLAVCEQCNKPLYNGIDIVRKTRRHYSGRSSTLEKYVICRDCEKKNIARAKQQAIDYSAECRKKSFIFGGLFSGLILIAWLVIALASGFKTGLLVFGIVASVLFFPFFSCLYLKNNFVGDMVEAVSMWGFVKFPGLIFSLDLQGIVWLLTVKLAFWILGGILAVIAAVFAVALGLVVRVFVYPFALKKSIVSPEKTDL